jgi:hypothetical protein
MDDQSRVTTDKPPDKDTGKTGPAKGFLLGTGLFLPALIVLGIGILVILFFALR